MKRSFFVLCLIVSWIGCVEQKEQVVPVQQDQKTPEKETFENRVIARIDGEPIMMSAVEEKVKGFTDKFREINPKMQFSEERLTKMRKDFLDRIIRDKILENTSLTVDIKISETEIDQRIEQFQMIFGEGEEARERFLGGIKDMDQFRKEVKKQIRIDKYFDLVLKDKLSVTDEDIETYYKQNEDRFLTSEQVNIQQIFFPVPSKESPDYESMYTLAMEKAQKAIKDAQSGEDFHEVSRRYVAGITETDSQIDVGWISKGKYPADVEQVIFSLKPGEISKPVESQSGIYVFRILERKEPGKMSLEEARDRVRSVLENRQKSMMREELYNMLHEKAEIEILL
ncbi:peptidyl-prolyl cis-trans isomerase [bacterium]|nr:peptidyl-prolyl cis-trans isomerase [candidate division CSSED10-310 bacterium]